MIIYIKYGINDLIFTYTEKKNVKQIKQYKMKIKISIYIYILVHIN